MLKKILSIILTICLLATLSVPVFAADDNNLSAIAKKLSKNPSVSNFTDSEISTLFKTIYNSDMTGVDLDEMVKWVKASNTVDATSLAIAFHEETHIFTYGLKNCERFYDEAEVKVNFMGDANYRFGGKTTVVTAVPMYLVTDKALSDTSSYKVIKKYLTDRNMLADNHGLHGMLSEYYAYVRELDFLVKYRDFCIKYKIKDTASARIKAMVTACNEWKKAIEAYVSFSKNNYDGSVYNELTKVNAIDVLANIHKEYAAIKVTSHKPEVTSNSDSTVQAGADGNNLAVNDYQVPKKQKFTSVLQVVVNFFETAFAEFGNWVQEFFA